MKTSYVIAIVIGVIIIGLGGWAGSSALRKQTPAPAEERRWVEVKRVRSGDRVTIKPDDDLQYAGLRAPIPDEPLFEESKKRNAKLVEGQRVRLRFDAVERDSKGRLVGYPFVDNDPIGEKLVREGLAYVRLTDDHRRYADELLAAQRAARASRKGLWAVVRFSDAPVIADPKYGNFHGSNCEELAKKPAERLINLPSAKAALDQGYAPCTRHCCD